MPLFFHDQFLFGDQVAFGIYRLEHQYEHSQFVQIAQAQVTPQLVPDYDLSSWQNTTQFARNWLTTHETVHEVLRGITGVSGINLADVDLGDENQFYNWIDAHRFEHAQLRQAFGIIV